MIRKFLSMLLLGAMLLSLSIPVSYAVNTASEKIITLETVNGATITENAAVEALDVEAYNFNLCFDQTSGFMVSLVLEDSVVVFDFILGYANDEHSSLAGYSINESNGYKLVNLKIDKCIPDFMLMKPTQALSNTSVLSIGFESRLGDLLYFQIPINEPAMEMIDYHCGDTMQTYESIDFASLYKMYLTNSLPRTTSVEVVEESLEYYNENNIMSLSAQATLKPVYEAFPLYFFTGGTMYTKVTGNYGNYYYARESSPFVGTNNVLTYFTALYKTTYRNYSTQEFYADYIVDYNDAVVYNPDSKDIFVWGVKNPGTVSSATVTIKCNNTNGCILKREQYAYIGGNSTRKIARAVITWVPYLSTAVASIETLASKEANAIETYGSSITEQINKYGNRIGSVAVTSNKLGSAGDHVYLNVIGDNITSTSITFSCEITF